MRISDWTSDVCSSDLQVIPDKSSGKIVVHGMVRGPIELPLGELIQDKITGEWHYKGERRDHPDWSTFNQIFHRFWNLLERGCRIQPGTEVLKQIGRAHV